MFNIAVFDRNIEHLKQIENYLNAFLFNECEYEIFKFLTEDDLITFFEEESVSFNLIILDADSETNVGFFAAEYIRRVNVKVEIVFITFDVSGLQKGYKYNAFDYLIKPVEPSEFNETLNRLFYYKQNSKSYFYIKINGSINRFDENEIVFFASTARKVSLFTEDDCVDFYAKLDEVMEQLDNYNFLRIHQSYIVNRQYVEKIEKQQVIMENGEILPISKKYFEDLKNAFENR